MNWKLVFFLLIFGITMGIAGLFGIPEILEYLIWFGIYIISAIIIAKKVTSKVFLHGFIASILNGICVAAIHIIFFTQYITNNPKMLDNLSKIPNLEPQIMKMIMGIVMGIIAGIITGLFAILTSRVIKKN